MEYGQMLGLYPAVIKSYDADSRMCRVEIAGLTDGGDVLPLAEIVYPVGSNSNSTEIKISSGDPAWVNFINGDPRYPIIVGYRNPHSGNSKDFTRISHKNIEIKAESGASMSGGGGEAKIQGSPVRIQGDLIVEGNISATGTIMDTGGNSNHHSH